MHLLDRKTADEYLKKFGYYPMIIGQEYLYLDQFARLLAADVNSQMATIETRFGTQAEVEFSALDWKPSKEEMRKK